MAKDNMEFRFSTALGLLGFYDPGAKRTDGVEVYLLHNADLQNRLSRVENKP